MFRKLLLLSFIVIAISSSMTNSITKGEGKDRTDYTSPNPVDKENIGNIGRNDKD